MQVKMICFRAALQKRCLYETDSLKKIYAEEATNHSMAAKYVEHSGSKLAMYKFMNRVRLQQKRKNNLVSN